MLLLNGLVITSHDEFNKLHLHVVVSDFERREIGIGVLHLLFRFILVHVSYIFQIIPMRKVKLNMLDEE